MAGLPYLHARVQDALGARLKDALDVACSVGYPAGGLRDRHVWVSGTSSATYHMHASGFGARAESGRVSVHVAVTMTSEEMTQPRDAALLLAGTVEAVLAEDRTLGGIVDRAWVAASEGQEAISEARRRQYGMTVHIEYEGSVAAE